MAQAEASTEWYAVQTRPRHEKAVAGRLVEEPTCAFLPLTTSVHLWSDRRKQVQEPLFPGYVFVQCDFGRHQHVPVLRTPGVVRFVGRGLKPQPISPEEIDTVREWSERNAPCRKRPYLRAGQRIRIRGGALDGMQGAMVRDAVDVWLVLSVGALDQSLEIKITGYEYDVL
jgi:transcription termination/antitermination protein NusG